MKYCRRCQETESAVHTFFTCLFSQKVWEKIPLLNAVHIAAVNTFKEVVIAFRKMPCLPPSEISLNVLPWICRTNWTSTNTLTFEKRLISPEDTAINDICLAKEWSKAQGNTIASRTLPPLRRIPSSFVTALPPEGETVRCMTDTAWKKDQQVACLAWIFTGQSLQTSIQESRFQRFVGSPLIAEALATDIPGFRLHHFQKTSRLTYWLVYGYVTIRESPSFQRASGHSFRRLRYTQDDFPWAALNIVSMLSSITGPTVWTVCILSTAIAATWS